MNKPFNVTVNVPSNALAYLGDMLNVTDMDDVMEIGERFISMCDIKPFATFNVDEMDNIFGKMNERQLRITLLGISHGESLTNAVMIAQTYA